MGKIIRNGVEYSGACETATAVNYDNSISGLNAQTVQEAIDEVNESLNYINKEIGHFIHPSKHPDLRTISRGMHMFSGFGTYTHHKPFDNALGIWFKTANDDGSEVVEIVINFSNGKMYKSYNYADFTTY